VSCVLSLEEKLKRILPKDFKKFAGDFKQIKYVEYARLADEMMIRYRDRLFPNLYNILNADVFQSYDVLFRMFDEGGITDDGVEIKSEMLIKIMQSSSDLFTQYTMLMTQRWVAYNKLDALEYFLARINGVNVLSVFDPFEDKPSRVPNGLYS